MGDIVVIPRGLPHEEVFLHLYSGRRRAGDLINTLRTDIGDHFLSGVRIFMAYRVHNSAIMSSYACNS